MLFIKKFVAGMSSAVDQPLKHVDQTYLLPEPVIVNSPDENRLSTVRRRGSTKEADTESILSMYFLLYVLVVGCDWLIVDFLWY